MRRLLAVLVVLCVVRVAFSAQEIVNGITWNYTVSNNKASIYFKSQSAAINISTYSTITIPSKLGGYPVTSIGNYAFYNCQTLTGVAIPPSVTSIGDYAFYNCILLTSVTIPDSVTSIGRNAFYNCGWITSMTIGKSVKSIGSAAFNGCSGLTSITIPNSVTNIGSSAFNGCSELTSVTIGNSVTSIGDSAFKGCSKLTSITIPNSVTNIGSSAFNGCSGLTSVHIADLAKWCGISFGDYSANPVYYAKNLYLNAEQITDLTIPDGVTTITDYAFHGCSGLTSVTIGESVTSIGKKAFSDCSGITSLKMPDFVTSIGEDAFSGCSGLTNVTIPDGVTSIEGGAFYGCSGLTSITIPDGVTSIGVYAFYNCSALTNVTIPDGVTSIGGFAFSKCSRLKSVVIPNSVTSIGEYAFYNCSALTNVTIPDGVTSIGEYAFYNCSALTNVTIPESVTSIGRNAFYNCRALTSVTIPESVTSIGAEAFNNCSAMTSVHIADLAKWCGISFGYFNANPLYCGHNLYLNGDKITDLTIPFGVKSIGDWAFYGCSGLNSVTIPACVTSIGEHAFRDCLRLANVTMQGDAPSVASYAFFNVPNGCTVWIPRGNKTYVLTNGKWQGLTVEYYDLPSKPTIDGDEGATVEGDAENGYTIKPSAGTANVELTIPEGVAAEKVTVEVAATVETVKSNGANVKVMNGEYDIASYLNLEAVTQDGVINISSAQVKEDIVKDALDTEKGAEVDISDPTSPELTTSETKPGLVYTLLEGATLGDMKDGDSKLGDGEKWTPNITVKGGTSGFYTIKVEK